MGLRKFLQGNKPQMSEAEAYMAQRNSEYTRKNFEYQKEYGPVTIEEDEERFRNNVNNVKTHLSPSYYSRQYNNSVGKKLSFSTLFKLVFIIMLVIHLFTINQWSLFGLINIFIESIISSLVIGTLIYAFGPLVLNNIKNQQHVHFDQMDNAYTPVEENRILEKSQASLNKIKNQQNFGCHRDPDLCHKDAHAMDDLSKYTH